MKFSRRQGPPGGLVARFAACMSGGECIVEGDKYRREG